MIGVSDYLPNTIWAMNFMDAQGIPVKMSSVAQDNQSAIKLATNGRASAGHKLRHINIRHFWIMDRLKSEGITIHHCPTEQMLADFLTKPLQGSLFHKFRTILLGHDPIHKKATFQPIDLPCTILPAIVAQVFLFSQNDFWMMALYITSKLSLLSDATLKCTLQ